MALPQSIDFHAHVMVPKIGELLASSGRPAPEEDNTHNRHLMETVYRAAFGQLERRFETMERTAIEMQVISTTPMHYNYWAPPDLADKIVAAANEYIADMCHDHPDKFVGLGAVALQHPELAPKHVADAMRLGLKGVEISTMAAGIELDDRRLEAFWSAAQEHDAVVFIHPSGCTLGARVAKYYLNNVIGNPLDTTIALTNLIFGGVLERYPRLKIVAAHGGGYLPSYFSRSMHGYEVRPECQDIPHAPDHYLHRNIWVDNLVYEPENVGHIVRVMGASRVVLGTDYPYDMGQDTPVAVLDKITDLSAEDRELITAKNAIGLLKLG